MMRLLILSIVFLAACQKQQLDLAEPKASQSSVKVEYSAKPELNPTVNTAE